MLAGICSYESLINGVMDLADVALLNDALDVRDENEARLMEHQQRG